ncbi:hypothetical protein [Zestomonas thermotolerans]|nr:hypothetical protein [Pseudomonas thermotolerans]
MHIATKSDWPDLKPMPASYEDMKIELHFSAAHMRADSTVIWPPIP